MLRKLITLLLVVLSLAIAQEGNWQEINSKIYSISKNYEKGKAREVMRAYAQALDSYALALRDGNELLGNSRLNKEQALDLLPYMIASSYRLAVATEKMVNGQMTYLFDQVERYKQAQELISQTLAQISNLRIDRQLEIPESMYGHLYYARALVNNGMAYTLANGNIWQRYFIYMPADIVQLMESVQSDLDHYLFLNKIKQRSDIVTNTKEFASAIIENSNLDKTLRLSYYTEERSELENALRQRYENIYTFKEKYNSNKELFRQVIEIKKYENYEASDVAKRFIEYVKYSLDLLKAN